MITDKLIQRLQSRFPDVGARFGAPPAPSVVIPAVHPEVGDIQIFDDGSEITLVAGNFTHGHFSDFDSKSQEEAERNVVEDVVGFLERLFAERVTGMALERVTGMALNLIAPQSAIPRFAIPTAATTEAPTCPRQRFYQSPHIRDSE